MIKNQTFKMLIAFLLNLSFALFEFFGYIYTGSVAIYSDAIHDLGDALSVGISYWLERKSKKRPDNFYTYGYIKYSVLGSLITSLALIVGSIIAIYNSIIRVINPVEINYNGMFLFAIFGVVVNLTAALVIKNGKSQNEKAVKLHMIEDVLGWIAVLIGSLLIKITNWTCIDSIISICISSFILFNAFKIFRKSIGLLMDKSTINPEVVKTRLMKIDGILNIHHLHIWSPDGIVSYATMHVITTSNHKEIKELIRKALEEFRIMHSTIELESKWECCTDKSCNININTEVKCACHNH